MFFVPRAGIHEKYGSWANKVLASIDRLGATEDISGLTSDQIRGRIAAQPTGEPACIIGGYALVPPFFRNNPIPKSADPDREIPTDAPFAVPPGAPDEDELAPVRPISRIPDGGDHSPTAFLKVLSFQYRVPTWRTPSGSFEEAAHEFAGAAGHVSAQLGGGTLDLSPPNTIDHPDPPPLIHQKGKIHILLHGANRSPDWAYLFGRKASDPPNAYPRALSARVLDVCDLRRCAVTFSSCYAAMLDTGESEAPARTEANQVALACLGHGSKFVVASTRSNWIDMAPPYNRLGPGLMGELWSRLAAGVPAARALAEAKQAFLASSMTAQPRNWAYVFKTLWQCQCYGHPDAVV